MEHVFEFFLVLHDFSIFKHVATFCVFKLHCINYIDFCSISRCYMNLCVFGYVAASRVVFMLYCINCISNCRQNIKWEPLQRLHVFDTGLLKSFKRPFKGLEQALNRP